MGVPFSPTAPFSGHKPQMIDDIFRLFSVLWLKLKKPIKESCRSNDVAPSYFPLQNCCKGDGVVSGVYLEITYGLSA